MHAHPFGGWDQRDLRPVGGRVQHHATLSGVVEHLRPVAVQVGAGVPSEPRDSFLDGAHGSSIRNIVRIVRDPRVAAILDRCPARATEGERWATPRCWTSIGGCSSSCASPGRWPSSSPPPPLPPPPPP